MMKVQFNGKDLESEIIKKLIEKIEKELNSSTQTTYVCDDGYEINTDVGYVAEWFEKYVKHYISKG